MPLRALDDCARNAGTLSIWRPLRGAYVFARHIAVTTTEYRIRVVRPGPAGAAAAATSAAAHAPREPQSAVVLWVLLVEDMEGGEARVRDFLLGECDLLRRGHFAGRHCRGRNSG